MKAKFVLVLSLICVFLTFGGVWAAGDEEVFSPYVDGKGGIRLPADFRGTWVHLGSWIVMSPVVPVAGLEETSPGVGHHNVYTQPEALRAFRATGKWPDGTMLIKEIRSVRWDDLPTGHVIAEGDVVKWLVMVKDSTGRFSANPVWGDGWGWALFRPGATEANAASNYKAECAGCHDAAKDSDRVFSSGYPPLRKE